MIWLYQEKSKQRFSMKSVYFHKFHGLAVLHTRRISTDTPDARLVRRLKGV